MLPARPAPTPALNQVIAERYRLKSILGTGGMGRVLKARDLKNQCDVAIKIIQNLDGDAVRRFEREAKIARKLDHPRCISVFNSGHDERMGAWYLTMELVEGGSLAEMLKGYISLAPRRGMSLMHQVAEALAYAHEQSIVHRDIKPANVLLSTRAQDECKLCDFGLARIFEPDFDQDSAPLTQHGQVLGTPAYLSPEQARGEPTDGASDVFAWGVMAYHTLSGRLPLEGQTPIDLMYQRGMNAPATPIEHHLPDLNQQLTALIMRCLEPEPESRPSSSELVDRVGALLPDLSNDLPSRSDTDATVPDSPARPRTVRLDAPPNLAPRIEREVREWQLQEELGRGGHGVVYRAHHTLLDRDFALKELHPQLASDPSARKRFLREAQVLVSLQHPSLVSSQAPFEAEGRLYLPMELLEGSSLDRLIGGQKTFSLPQSLNLILQAAEAVGAAHQAEVLHRDLKPSNLFITDPARPTVKVMDFGLARVSTGQTITKTSMIVGTPQYLAPEALRGDAVDARADVYALGLVLYELLEGSLPWDLPKTEDAFRLVSELRRVHQGPSPVLSSTIPEPVRNLVERCLSQRPEDRPADGAALAAELLALLQEPLDWSECPSCGLKHRARPDERCPKCGGSRRGRRRKRIALAVIGGLAQVAVFGLIYKGYQELIRIPVHEVQLKTRKRHPLADQAQAEVDANLKRIVEAQMRYFAKTGRFLPVRPEGPASATPKMLSSAGCSPACRPPNAVEDPKLCGTLSCLGVRFDKPVRFRYGCSVADSGKRDAPAITCAAEVDLDADGHAKLFVLGSGGDEIRAPIPPSMTSSATRCAPGKTPARAIVDCTPEHW